MALTPCLLYTELPIGHSSKLETRSIRPDMDAFGSNGWDILLCDQAEAFQRAPSVDQGLFHH